MCLVGLGIGAGDVVRATGETVGHGGIGVGAALGCGNTGAGAGSAICGMGVGAVVPEAGGDQNASIEMASPAIFPRLRSQNSNELAHSSQGA